MEFCCIATLFLGMITFYLFHKIITKNNNYWENFGISYVPTTLLLQIKDMLKAKRSIVDKVSRIYKMLKEEKFTGYYHAFIPILMIRDPELINRILVTDFIHFEDRCPRAYNEKDLITLNLSCLSGDKWRNAKQKLAPTFTSGKLRLMFTEIKKCSDELLYHISNRKNEDVEVKDLMRRFILKVIGNVIFGLNVDSLTEKEHNNDFLRVIHQFFNPSYMQLAKIYLNFTAFLGLKFFRFKLVNSEVETFFRMLAKDLIKHRRESDQRKNDFLQIMLEEMKKEETDLRKEFSTNPSNRNEYKESEDAELLKNIDCLNKIGSPGPFKIFTEDFIAAQAFGFISIGCESTATPLSFILYELAANQDVQERLRKEILEVIKEFEFNYHAISKMTFLDQCIYETLRKHPVLTELSRVCTNDYKLPGTDFVIKKGTLINIPTIGLHMDPQYFPEPDNFIPDRFKDMKAIPKGVYFPFGGGPRFCIAMRFAMLEMKTILAALLSNFTVDLSKNLKLPLQSESYSFTGEIEGGILLNFKSIKE